MEQTHAPHRESRREGRWRWEPLCALSPQGFMFTHHPGTGSLKGSEWGACSGPLAAKEGMQGLDQPAGGEPGLGGSELGSLIGQGPLPWLDL